MRTKDELFRAAQREVAAYRQQAVMQAETARRAAYAAHPALAEADSAHLRAGLGLAKAAALGGNMDTARAALTRADEALAAAVKEAGFSADDFKPAYRCPLCEDTGMRGGVPCRCVADAARRLRRDEINAASPLGLCQFASFEVERYSDAVEPELGISPREYMGKLLNYCRGYAAKFSQNSPNLLFMGHTGLGKTHLALAIADAVLEGGHDVLYTSAAALAAQVSVLENKGEGFALLDASVEEPMKAAIRAAGAEGDSVGGMLETAILGLPAGIGEPYFDSVESEIAHLVFSVPAVKGIEFGTGFGFAGMRGSEANDAFRMTPEGAVVTATNHNAGINGGIANGMPVVFRTAVKPTPSIYKTQDTVDYMAKKDAELSIQGRHDPCIVPRAAIVQTCAAALAVGDLLTAKYGMAWMEDRLPQGGAVNGIRTHRRAAGPLLLQGHPRDALRLPVRPVPPAHGRGSPGLYDPAAVQGHQCHHPL